MTVVIRYGLIGNDEKLSDQGGRGMKTVDELVSEWTEEEREKMKDLIHESREREKALMENSRVWKENLVRLTELLSSLSLNAYGIREKAARLEEDMWGIYLHLYKKEMPSS
ncbi:MAG: hypothetical protein EHM36_16525 [Deltaproteobacteria bacterium]|nr:MAG: hypothetical protein EHM36_16525 [Deltaproteobacteria bacterium]